MRIWSPYGSGSWNGLLAARLYPEVLTPIAAPALLDGVHCWQELPRIAVAGPRPGWQEWAERTGDAAPPAPRYRFDSFVAALGAARAGLGVLLGSVPLCAPGLADGTLRRLSQDALTQAAGYWLTAREDSMPARQWQQLMATLCAHHG